MAVYLLKCVRSAGIGRHLTATSKVFVLLTHSGWSTGDTERIRTSDRLFSLRQGPGPPCVMRL